MTKSFAGTLAGILIADGKIDPQAPITDYVPELKASAFGDARVHEPGDSTPNRKIGRANHRRHRLTEPATEQER